MRDIEEDWRKRTILLPARRIESKIEKGRERKATFWNTGKQGAKTEKMYAENEIVNRYLSKCSFRLYYMFAIVSQ